MTTEFDTVLVANRGEIAVRVIRTARAMGLRAVAVYSDADAHARHVQEADVAVRLGPAPAAQSYLSIDRVLAAARESGANAVHPGYGFLAENAAFARACAAAGLVFVGPPAEAVEIMGDKIRAKQTVVTAGVPVTPGRAEPGLDNAALAEAAHEIGFPVLIKPSAGGGGKGMHRVDDPIDLDAALVAARREAASSFGDDTLFVERFVLRPRHIEIQVLADTHGTVMHLGERECSLQRRHQKIVEEAPSVLLTPQARQRMGQAAVDAARAVGYTGAGTVEFIVSADRPDEFFFMEMNTRLQVEHPVTEMVTGVDLVEQQLRVAAGLPLDVPEPGHRGHAVEARVYAEDPAREFLPTGGPVLALREPTGEHVRIDSGLRVGDEIGSLYDPMLAKVIAWGPTRDEAIRRLDRALADYAVLGVGTNVPFLRALLADEDVRAGTIDTDLVARRAEVLSAPTDDPTIALATAGVVLAMAARRNGSTFAELGSWGVRGTRAAAWDLVLDGEPRAVTTRETSDGYLVNVGNDVDHLVSVEQTGDGDLAVRVDKTTHALAFVHEALDWWFAHEGTTWHVARAAGATRDRKQAGESSGDLRSPMPGTVVAVSVADGDAVVTGQAVVVVEAMKMEHSLVAPFDGTVTQLAVRAGDTVAMDALLATVTAPEEEAS